MGKSYGQALTRLIEAADLGEKRALLNDIAKTDRNLAESVGITWLKNSKMLVGNVGKCQAYLPIGIYLEGWLFPTNHYDAIEIFSGNEFIACATIGEPRNDVYNNFPFFNERKAGFYCFITEHLETIEKNEKLVLLVKKNGKVVKKMEQTVVCNSVKKSIEQIKENLHEKNNILVPTLTNQMQRLSVIAKQMPEYNFIALIEGMQESMEEAEKFCLDNGLSGQDLNTFFLTMVPDLLRRNNVPRHCEMDLNGLQISACIEDGLIDQAAMNFQAKYNTSREYALCFCLACISYARQLIEIAEPKMILMWNKFSPWHMMLALTAEQYAIPVVYMENGVLPGTLIYEMEGQMGESYPAIHSDAFCDLEVDKNDLDNAQRVWDQLYENKLNRWISSDASVYKEEELKKVKEQINPEWPTILYAAQNDFESGLYPYTEHSKKFHSPIFESSEEAAVYLGKLAKRNHWNLIYKRHPMMRGKLIAELPENIIVNDNINIHDAIDMSDLVITILSQTSYVSLIRKKPALMLGYHQLNHKGCIYETDEKDEVEGKIMEALEQGFTGIQKENFKRHIAQLCKYYLYRDFTNDEISYGKNIYDLCSWLNEVINNCPPPIFSTKNIGMIETRPEKEVIESRFTLELSLRERWVRRRLKKGLSNHAKICDIIFKSITKDEYENLMMLISQIDPNYLEEKNWDIVFSKIMQFFIGDTQERLEEFLSLNSGLHEEIRKRLKTDILLGNIVKAQIAENRIMGVKRAFDMRYRYSQKLFLQELHHFIFELVNKREIGPLYDLIEECKSDDVYVSYIMELIFQSKFFDSILMKKWMQTLLASSNMELLYYFGVMELDRILFLYPECLYDEYYSDRNRLLKRTAALLNLGGKWERKKKESNRNIAMIVVGLHGKNFASTRLQVGLANRLNEDGWKVTIYVADTNYISTVEKFIVNPKTVRHNFSKEIYQRDHWQMLDVGVEVRYFNQKEDDAERYQRLIGAIYEDNPQAIIDITNEQAIYNIQLMKDFPVISVPLNGYATSASASCYVARNIDYVHRLEKIHGKIDAQRLAEANLYLPYPTDKTKYDRKRYGFTEKDILVVTVGNRLDYEITGEVQKKMKEMLSKERKIKWIVVGAVDRSNFETLQEELLKGQVVFWGYEPKLYKLYHMCDVYLDLPRLGGGGAAALAVQCGLPAVIVQCFSDILPFLGEENAVKDFGESLMLLKELAKSRVKRKQMNKDEYRRLMSEQFTMKNFAKVVADEIIAASR